MSDESIKTFMVTAIDSEGQCLALRFISGKSVWDQEVENKINLMVKLMVPQVRKRFYINAKPSVVRDHLIDWQIYLVSCKYNGFPKYLRDWKYEK